MNTRLRSVAITGAAGRIGSALRVALREDFPRLVLVDRQQCEPASAAEEARRVDLRDAGAVLAALKDADAVVHLGGIRTKRPCPDWSSRASWARTTFSKPPGGTACGGSFWPAPTA